MKLTRTFAVALALTAPLAAGEVGLLAGKLVGKAQVANATFFGNNSGARYDAVSPTGFGIRAGYTLLNLGVAELGLAATYHTKAEGDLNITLPAPINTKVNAGKYGVQYLAIGAQADWKFLVNLHVGADIRQEKLEFGSESVTYTRPWVKAGIGFSVPLPVVSPFARLELAVPTTKEDKTGSSNDLMKAMAPTFQAALYAGIRF